MKNKLSIASWNIHTLLDLAETPDRPHCRAALGALELARYNIDIAALSETRLYREDSVSEGGAGYTFFWKGAPEGTRHNHGVGFAEHNIKEDFYKAHDAILQKTLATDRLILMREFNARVGTEHLVWSKVIGQHGVGKMNHTGLRLLSLCVEH